MVISVSGSTITQGTIYIIDSSKEMSGGMVYTSSTVYINGRSNAAYTLTISGSTISAVSNPSYFTGDSFVGSYCANTVQTVSGTSAFALSYASDGYTTLEQYNGTSWPNGVGLGSSNPAGNMFIFPVSSDSVVICYLYYNTLYTYVDFEYRKWNGTYMASVASDSPQYTSGSVAMAQLSTTKYFLAHSTNGYMVNILVDGVGNYSTSHTNFSNGVLIDGISAACAMSSTYVLILSSYRAQIVAV